MWAALIGSVMLPLPAVDDAATRPIDAAALAFVHADVPVAAGPATSLQPWGAAPPSAVTWEQCDNWWAEDGAMLILAAVHPLPESPLALGLVPAVDGRLSLALDIQVSATTR